MIGDIRKHLAEDIFIPFTIHLADGRTFHIPTRDHIFLPASRAMVLRDNGDYDILSGLLMTGLKVDASTVETREKP